MARGLELSRKGISVITFTQNSDGPGVMLRLWELNGEAGTVTVTLPPGTSLKTAQPVNLRATTDGIALPIRNNTFTFKIRAYAPASFILRPGLPAPGTRRIGLKNSIKANPGNNQN
jgi:hypothetical protein